MVFDWFRRKYKADDAQAKPGEAETSQAPASPELTSGGDAEAEPAAADPAADGGGEGENEDYLEWAKAAFQNIKAQQSAQETAPEAEAAEAVEAVEAVEAEVETDAVAIAPDPPAPEITVPELAAPELAAPELATPEPAAPAIAPSPDAPAAIRQQPEPEIEPAIESASPGEPETEAAPEPAPEPAALPFLARAEAERQARLERLQATAIEEPEPEILPEASPENRASDWDDGPRIVFDADFIWSSEVLAAQGRRPDDISLEEITWLKRLRQGLDKTRRNLINQLKSIVGQGPLNDDAVLEIESLLLQADVGVSATDYIIEALQAKLKQEALPPEAAIAYLKRLLRELLDSPLGETDPPVLAPEKGVLNIWLLTGVNGAGKTTTIGKLAHLATKSDYKCLIAAADTFRAAAVEQVKVWGDRSGTEVIANPGQNTDPAAVVFDAVEAARRRDIELLLVDTAGRLQNKKNLMAELAKVRRIIDKKAPEAKVESLLVLDATLGQNGLRQAEVFAQAANLSGVVLTKLDGTARGGVALAVVRQLGLPIRFIGAGEGIGDLRPFSSYEFVEALLSN
ncbi:MAG: signal recognition particle-docking protein FtsY [Synechococcales cyanobacterium RM1_1_8]|nr:signal recognition particle-docking protein FtsY [Synechococcales cyanobacterium RM1_1_8]